MKQQNLRKTFYTKPHALRWSNEEVSSEFRLRKAHWEGEGNACCCLNIPKQFWQRMEIDKQSYLKVTYMNDGNKLVVEKIPQ